MRSLRFPVCRPWLVRAFASVLTLTAVVATTHAASRHRRLVPEP